MSRPEDITTVQLHQMRRNLKPDTATLEILIKSDGATYLNKESVHSNLQDIACNVYSVRKVTHNTLMTLCTIGYNTLTSTQAILIHVDESL